jgi:putative transcriptional regulator
METRRTATPVHNPVAPLLSAHKEPSLQNHVLIAMPQLSDGFFNRSVIYVCAHSHEGAMGIVINQRMPDIEFSELLDQLHLPQSAAAPVVHFGGPVETGRGFVLHSTDFQRDDTVRLTEGLSLTGTIDILRAISEGRGPRQSIFALGYAGWGPGQLEAELQANSWLAVPADDDLIFSPDLPHKWDLALARLGVSPLMLSIHGGTA